MLNYPLLYLEHLSRQDLDLLARHSAAPSAAALRSRLSKHPEVVDEYLAAPQLYEALFGGAKIAPGVSTFLTFGVLVHRSARDLKSATYLPEWTGPGRRLPVFDAVSLRDFLDHGARRYFLIELLASFTRVASWSRMVRTRHGYRRRRYSELDPVRLADFVEEMPTLQRPAGYRRLGDVSLFLTGVFPDHTATHPLAQIERIRLAHSAGLDTAGDVGDDVEFHEAAGAAWYRRAVEAAAVAVGTGPEYLLDVADHFGEARRVLNYLADHYLFKIDSGLLGPA